MAKVSVVIPTYNRAGTIERAVRSVLNQSFSDLELLVVDDGSVDKTKEVVSGIADERLRLIVLDRNYGASYARNEGVRQAGGEWIAFQDSDDCWREDKLEKQLAFAEKNPKFEMIYGLCAMHLLDGRILVRPIAEGIPSRSEDLFEKLLEINVIMPPAILVKRKSFMDVRGFDISYSSLEDWEFALRFSQKYQIGFMPEVVSDVYESEGSLSADDSSYFLCRCKMISMYQRELADTGLFDRVVGRLLKQAEEDGVLDYVKKILMLCLQE